MIVRHRRYGRSWRQADGKVMERVVDCCKHPCWLTAVHNVQVLARTRCCWLVPIKETLWNRCNTLCVPLYHNRTNCAHFLCPAICWLALPVVCWEKHCHCCNASVMIDTDVLSLHTHV